MKKLLFVENRYATEIYSQIACELRDVFDISFLVQNHRFKVPSSRNHVIPYPLEKDLCYSSKYKELSRKDRGHNFFDSGNRHYKYYDEKILAVLVKECPDVVIGEATLFHELLTIENCKKLNITYISPNATRYPTGRLAFYKNDSLEMVTRSLGVEECTRFNAEQALLDINQRKVIPSYMVEEKGTIASINRKFRIFISALNVALSRATGEKYNTPTVRQKLYLSLKHQHNRRKWESIASDYDKNPNEIVIMVPLQMQPEGNLDVWGFEFSDQCELIEMLSNLFLNDPVSIIVKPNPKSKYELSARLIDLIKTKKNVIGLEHKSLMSDVLNQTDIVMSVTGTIIMECVFLEKPVVVFGSHEFSKLPGVYKFSKDQNLQDLRNYILFGPYLRAKHCQKLSVLSDIYNNSYDAVLWDPINQPEYNSMVNYVRLSRAIEETVDSL